MTPERIVIHHSATKDGVLGDRTIDPKLLTTTEVAEILGVSQRWVRKLCQSDHFKGAKLRTKRLWLIPAKSVKTTNSKKE